MAKESRPSHPIVLYGVVIQDALARGDIDEMNRVAAAARAHLDHYGDVAQGLANLQTAIRGKGGPPAIALYGVVIQDALKSGDQDKLKELLGAAEQQLGHAGALKEALSNLKAEIAKLEKEG